MVWVYRIKSKLRILAYENVPEVLTQSQSQSNASNGAIFLKMNKLSIYWSGLCK